MTHTVEEKAVFIAPMIKPIPIVTNIKISVLFAFGSTSGYEIWVGKKGKKAYCYQDDDESYYDYQCIEDALIGGSEEFEVKRIIVLQFI